MKLQLALVAAAAGFGALVPSADAGRSGTCAQGLLPLSGANPIGAATTAALRREKPSTRPQVVGAVWAPRDRERGLQAKAECGARAWKRTVVVYVTLRALLPSQSLSQNVFFVGRFKGGYRVWQVVH